MQLSQVKMFVLYGGLVIDSNYIWDGVVMWLERYLIGEVEKLKVLKSYERFLSAFGKDRERKL